MKYALIGGNKAEAVKGSKGICPNCRGDVVAKCGEFNPSYKTRLYHQTIGDKANETVFITRGHTH